LPVNDNAKRRQQATTVVGTSRTIGPRFEVVRCTLDSGPMSSDVRFLADFVCSGVANGPACQEAVRTVCDPYAALCCASRPTTLRAKPSLIKTWGQSRNRVSDWEMGIGDTGLFGQKSSRPDFWFGPCRVRAQSI